MRNLVLIHLESLSEYIYRMDSDYFPNLREWEKKSLSYKNYFSTATSTFMVMSDLAYGDMLPFEKSDAYCSTDDQVGYGSFLDEYEEKGYRVRVLEYSSVNDAYLGNDNNFVGRRVKVETHSDYNGFLKEIENAISKSPFLLWVYDVQNNIDVNYDICCNRETTRIPGLRYVNRIEGYRHLDRMVCDVMSLLKKNDLLKNTGVIFYGDHGDDLFFHGWHRGYSHAIEPYATLIKTPMWIFDNRIEPGVSGCLCDTTDIKELAACLMDEKDADLINYTMSSCKRRYSFSRNMYAAQMLKSHLFNKGYSITDGEYILIASNLGLRFHWLQLDHINAHNLLDYFDLVNGEVVVNKNVFSECRGHFVSLFDIEELETIAAKFKELYEALLDKIRITYEYAERTELLTDLKLNEIEYSKDIAEYRETQCNNLSVEFDFHRSFFRGKKIVIYGAGNEGRKLHDNLKTSVEIVAWVDRNFGELSNSLNEKVSSPSIIGDLSFDYIIIAIYSPAVRKSIKAELVSQGIKKEIIF